MSSALPLTLVVNYPVFDRILKNGKILSKGQLTKLGISFQQHTTSYVSLEHALGTFDDVTLFIDPLFRSDLYGGHFNLGPRIIFDREVLYQEGVFMLPTDQGAYYDGLADRPRPRFQNFENDKMKSREEKDRFIARMNIDSIIGSENPLIFESVPCPEVHVPREIALSMARAYLIHADFVERYRQKPELQGKPVIPFFGKNGTLSPPDSLSLLQAYKEYLRLVEMQI